MLVGDLHWVMLCTWRLAACDFHWLIRWDLYKKVVGWHLHLEILWDLLDDTVGLALGDAVDFVRWVILWDLHYHGICVG